MAVDRARTLLEGQDNPYASHFRPAGVDRAAALGFVHPAWLSRLSSDEAGPNTPRDSTSRWLSGLRRASAPLGLRMHIEPGELGRRRVRVQADVPESVVDELLRDVARRP
jgi:hypothetical protein